MNKNTHTEAVTGERTAARNEEAERLAEFGMFGTDFYVTKAMLRRQLKRHGLVLKIRKNYAKWGDNVEIWIEQI